MLGTEDTNTSPGLTRAAFARAGEPKRLLELDGDHYSIYPWGKGHNFDKVSQATAEWFVQNLSA